MKPSGKHEKGIDAADCRVLVEVDARYFRPTEVDILVGDAGKAHEKLRWHHKTTFDALKKDMIEADLTTILEEYNRSHHDD